VTPTDASLKPTPDGDKRRVKKRERERWNQRVRSSFESLKESDDAHTNHHKTSSSTTTTKCRAVAPTTDNNQNCLYF
jgi:hypothetical protein